MSNIANLFFGKVLEGIIETAKKKGGHILVNPISSSSLSYTEFLEELTMFNPVGVILLGDVLINNSTDYIEKLKLKYPVILCSWHYPNVSVPYVSIDLYRDIQRIIHYLIEHGKKSITFMTMDPSFPTMKYLLDGYKEALGKYDLTPNVIELPGNYWVDYNISYAVCLQLFQSSRIPDALVCVTDYIAASAIKAAKSLNLSVPEDCSIVGCDNTEIALVTEPGLTTIHLPRYQLGCLGMELMLKHLINPSAESTQTILESELVIRSSAF